MALDEDGKLYIADSGNHRISVVSTRRGCPGSLSPITWFGGMGVGDGLLSMPYGVAVAKQEDGGLVYVADTGSNRLCVFTRSGNFVKSLGSSSGRSRLPGRMRCRGASSPSTATLSWSRSRGSKCSRFQMARCGR